MKSAWLIAAGACIALTGCKGGENAERAGANIDGSEVEITAPIGRDIPSSETAYSPRTETIYSPRTETDYTLRTESAGGTVHTDGM